MNLRDLMWKTKSGELIKIRELKTEHLENIPGHIEKNKMAYLQNYGEKKLALYLQAITHELRLRKLNRIKNNPDGEIF